MKKYNYENILDYIQQGKNKTDRPTDYKPKNTRFVIIDESAVGVKYHDTIILTFYKDGYIHFDSGGWKTPTTKDRINHFQDRIYVYQQNSQWYFNYTHPDHSGIYYFTDGMIIRSDGSVLYTTLFKDSKDNERDKLKKRIQSYCREFANRFVKGEIDRPDGGDCWICVFDDDSTDHLISHMDESYFVPRLLDNALKAFDSKLSKYDRHNIMVVWSKTTEHSLIGNTHHYVEKQIEKALKAYMYKRFGFVA